MPKYIDPEDGKTWLEPLNDDSEWEGEPSGAIKRHSIKRIIRSTMKARLIEDNTGTFWIPMNMIVEFGGSWIDIYSTFRISYNWIKNAPSGFSSIDEDS